MATVNIGNLTFTHKGDYASGTTYAKNDVVYYSTNGNAYIAKQATTGNAPTSTAHWDVFAAGSGGIWNAGLSLGSAGQSVKVNSAGNALEFGTVSGYTDNDVKTLLTGASSYPVFACRGWANVTGGTAAIRASGNCSSITDVGVGHYRFNFTTAMNDINYVVTGASAENWSGSTDSHNDHAGFGLRRKLFTTSMFEFETRGQWSNTDHEMVCVATFR